MAYDYAYYSFRLYMGNPGQLVEIKFNPKDVQYYADGGTTVIPTEKGVLYFPAKANDFDSFTPKGGKRLRLEHIEAKGDALLKIIGAELYHKLDVIPLRKICDQMK